MVKHQIGSAVPDRMSADADDVSDVKGVAIILQQRETILRLEETIRQHEKTIQELRTELASIKTVVESLLTS